MLNSYFVSYRLNNDMMTDIIQVHSSRAGAGEKTTAVLAQSAWIQQSFLSISPVDKGTLSDATVARLPRC